MRKRVSSFIMAIVMLFALLPLNAFAASTATFTIGDVEAVAGDTVTIPVTVSGLSDVYVTNIYGKFELTEGLNLVSVTPGSNLEGFTNGVNVLGAFQYDANDVMSGKTVSDGTVFTIEASVPDDAVEGSQYTVNMNLSTLADQDMEDITYTVDTGIITVGTVSTDPYTAALSGITTTVDDNDTDKVVVDVVVGGTTGSFASTETKLSYDPDYLTFDKENSACKLVAVVPDGKTDQPVEFIVAKDENDKETGTLTIRDYGGNMTVAENGTTAYTLNFNTVKGGETNISLVSAGFSTKEKAETENLIAATPGSKVDVTINHEATITVNGAAGTTDYVTPNGNYTYQIGDYNATNYAYTVTATENNIAVADSRITVSDTGLVTITGVNGQLAVTITSEARTYTIVWKDTEEVITSTKPTTQNYGTDVIFTVKPGSKADDSTSDGYYYSVKAYLTNDATSTLAYTSNQTDKYAEQTYTIDDTVITGDITIEVTKVEEKATAATITIDGNFTELKINGVTPEENTVTVPKGSNVTVTVSEEDGYTYTVATVVGETTTKLEKNTEGNYTFTPNEATVLKVTKDLNTSTLDVTEYVQLDGKMMWLVKINGLTDTTGKTYTYTASEGATPENFFWSSKYTLTSNATAGAYCFLVVTDTDAALDTVKADVASKLSLVDSAATAIVYDGNVNLTKNGDEAAVIDVNDAQLVWNMYSTIYNEITADVTVRKFLEADVNGNGEVETTDAAAVVAKIQ